jgi:hypothetical protein
MPHPAEALALPEVPGMAAQWLGWRLRIPALVVLIPFGLLAGPVLGLIRPSVALGQAFQLLVQLAVAADNHAYDALVCAHYAPSSGASPSTNSREVTPRADAPRTSRTGAHRVYTAGVAGSIPAAPANRIIRLGTARTIDPVLRRLFATALPHSFANERSVAMASFRKCGSYNASASSGIFVKTRINGKLT